MSGTLYYSKAKDWKPRMSEDGTIYCSPACGCRCKKADYDKAVARSQEIAARMGEGWKPIVSENDGWHWKIEKGCATIREYTMNRYASEDSTLRFYADIKLAGGKHTLTFSEAADGPEVALSSTAQKALSFLLDMKNALKAVLE